jgi:two-component system chemotaxis response regulator CheB
MNRPEGSAAVRVLLVEALRGERQRLSGVIDAAPALTLVGVANNSAEALESAARLRPDVIAINTQVYGSDGFAISRLIMQACPAPIVLFGEHVDSPVADQATAAGALTVVRRPGHPMAASYGQDCAFFIKTLQVMAGVPVITRFATRAPAPSAPTVGASGQPELLAIAASTGGPGAVHRIIRQLRPNFPAPIVLVQHIAHTFVQSLAEWLRSVTALPVEIVRQEQRLAPGRLYLALANHHLVLGRRGWVTIRPGIPGAEPYCPSADILFHSVAQSYGSRAIGLILSGMGDDGAQGLAAMRQAGSMTLAQNEASCVVYGMPQAAVRANAVQQVGALDDLSAMINSQFAHR